MSKTEGFSFFFFLIAWLRPQMSLLIWMRVNTYIKSLTPRDFRTSFFCISQGAVNDMNNQTRFGQRGRNVFHKTWPFPLQRSVANVVIVVRWKKQTLLSFILRYIFHQEKYIFFFAFRVHTITNSNYAVVSKVWNLYKYQRE